MKVYTLIYVGLLSLLISCGAKQENISSTASSEELQMEDANAKSPEIAERKLIKEGNISFETHSIIETKRNISLSVKKYKGYISSENESRLENSRTATISIRVPSENFDVLLNEITQYASSLESKDIFVRDVTEDFLDIQSRLKNKKALESTYLVLLTRAKTVIEILEIEKQIGSLRADIESVEGRMRFMQNQISYSTLTVNIKEPVPYQKSFANEFKNGFVNGWNNLFSFFVLLVNVWPFIIIAIGIFFTLNRINKKSRIK